MIRAVLLALLLAGCAKADPAMEKKAVGDYPTSRATAVTVYFRDCSGPDSESKITCHSCGDEIFVEPAEINVYADNNEQIFEGNPPEIKVTGEITHRYNKVAAADMAREKAKGAASFEKYLTGLFEAGNDWCASYGGTRHDLKNVIADAARGKLVDMK
ncbi:MAG TPA: hypothetical protein VG889_08190 [Rhizomicrobium sp.]|nr:hypothetical protein [Rhizomicrobium sp.]